ncbi:hypothetical protein QTP88_009636 [Uroleucon formosanum]
MGSVVLTTSDKNQTFETEFHVVPPSFPIDGDGILGKPFLKENKIIINVDQEEITYPDNAITTIPARSEAIIPIRILNEPMTDSQNILIHAQNINEHIICGNLLNEIKQNQILIAVINPTESPQTVKIPSLNKLSHETFEIVPIKFTQSKEVPKNANNRIQLLKENLRCDHMNNEEKESIERLCSEYSDIFFLEGDTLSCTETIQHEIKTSGTSQPVFQRPYRLPYSQKKEIDKQIEQLEQDGIISPSDSPWNAPLLVVPKKTDASGIQKYRVVIDFRKLNEITVGDAFPMPDISTILDQLGKAKYFSCLDMASGYHQIALKPEDKHKTAFSTEKGHFEFNRMCFGLKGAPATFQRSMNRILIGLNGVKSFVYLDDVIVIGTTIREHEQNLRQIFERFRKHGLQLQPTKCEFLRREVIYLGHVITEQGVKPDPKKIQCMVNYPTPTNAKDVKSFLGLVGYYRRFIRDFSKKAKPLTNLLKQNQQFIWSDLCQESFNYFKNILINEPILQYPDSNQPFNITTDASNIAIGAILSQGKIGSDLPIAYASRTLNKAETNYNTTEKELLAILWAVKQFRHYVYGCKFNIVTDHKPLSWLFGVKDPGARLTRWRLQLEEVGNELDELNWEKVRAIIRYIFKNSKIKVIIYVDIEYSEEEKLKIIEEFHNAPLGGHQGLSRTIKRIKLHHQWKGLKSDVKKFIASCQSCQQNKSMNRTIKQPMVITTTAKKPFEKIFLDIVGPLTTTNEGHSYILTIQDDLTKFSAAFPLVTHDANSVAKTFVEKFICQHGIPESIVTDCGTEFMSKIFKECCKLLKIEKMNTTPYHPQSNGGLERFHRTLAEYLRHYVNKNQTDWDEYVAFAIFVYNTTVHTTTNHQPYELVYGFPATVPHTLSRTPQARYNYDDYAYELKQKLQETCKSARNNIQKNKEKAKKKYDQGELQVNVKVGDQVWVKNHQQKGNYQAYNFLSEISSNKEHVMKIIDQPKNSYRSKRGLINLVGRVANVLFGVCDDTDVEYFYSKIRDLESSNSRISKSSDAQIQIMQSIISNVNSSLLEINKNEINLADKYNFLLHEMQTEKAAIGTLNFKTALEERISLLNIILTQYAFETGNLLNIINMALQGFVHSSILDTNTFKNQLKDIKAQLPIGEGIPIDLDNSGISELLRLITTNIVYIENYPFRVRTVRVRNFRFVGDNVLGNFTDTDMENTEQCKQPSDLFLKQSAFGKLQLHMSSILDLDNQCEANTDDGTLLIAKRKITTKMYKDFIPQLDTSINWKTKLDITNTILNNSIIPDKGNELSFNPGGVKNPLFL